MKQIPSALLSLTLLTLSNLLYAADAPTQLELGTTVGREVPNDQLNAVLYIQERQKDPAKLADRVNRTMADAVKTAQRYPKVEVSTGAIYTWPEYDKNGHIQGWSSKAEIRLTSSDLVESAQLVAQLQKTMLLQGVDFNVSEAARRQAEQQLLPEAIARMKQTAKQAALALGKTHVYVKELRIENSSGTARMPYAMLAAAPKATNNDNTEVTPPSWEPGKSQIQMQVSGTLMLE